MSRGSLTYDLARMVRHHSYRAAKGHLAGNAILAQISIMKTPMKSLFFRLIDQARSLTRSWQH
ncbi:hypothetical protein AGROH133_14828 (plasmid) [Agrobacterium tumefaciens]|nr:hypothetical protein AGROH133_14828 [Agrobacterium tumefaciens]